jgi:hypothetical protein
MTLTMQTTISSISIHLRTKHAASRVRRIRSASCLCGEDLPRFLIRTTAGSNTKLAPSAVVVLVPTAPRVLTSHRLWHRHRYRQLRRHRRQYRRQYRRRCDMRACQRQEHARRARTGPPSRPFPTVMLPVTSQPLRPPRRQRRRHRRQFRRRHRLPPLLHRLPPLLHLLHLA